MNVFTEISTRELENTLKGKAVRYIVNDAGEGLCLFFEGWTDNTGSNHGDAILKRVLTADRADIAFSNFHDSHTMPPPCRWGASGSPHSDSKRPLHLCNGLFLFENQAG